MTTPKDQPTPPEGCICASFWTIRQKHKSDCPLAQPTGFEEKLKHITGICDCHYNDTTCWYWSNFAMKEPHDFNDYQHRAILTIYQAELAALEERLIAALPEKFTPEMDSVGDTYLTDTKDGWNRALDQATESIKRVFKEMK